MEDIYKRFPLLGDKIIEKVNYKSLVKLKETGREISGFLDNSRALWKRIILKNISSKNLKYIVHNRIAFFYS